MFVQCGSHVFLMIEQIDVTRVVHAHRIVCIPVCVCVFRCGVCIADEEKLGPIFKVDMNRGDEVMHNESVYQAGPILYLS